MIRVRLASTPAPIPASDAKCRVCDKPYRADRAVRFVTLSRGVELCYDCFVKHEIETDDTASRQWRAGR